jgi:hypothetical protein
MLFINYFTAGLFQGKDEGWLENLAFLRETWHAFSVILLPVADLTISQSPHLAF